MLKRRVVTICREGLYYLFVLAFVVGGAALRDVNLLFLLAGLMIGPLLLNWRTVVLTLRQLEVERRLPKQVFAGQPFVVEVRAQNRRRRMGTWLLMVEDWVHAEESRPDQAKPPAAVAARAVVPYVSAGGVGRTSYRVQCPRRGAYRFGPLRVSTRFPLGLMKAAARQRLAERVVVFPRLGTLSPGWTRLLDPTRLGRYQTSHRQGPIDGDYYGLREWRPGDSRRWIHWRTTAKLGKLAVRQFEQQQNRDLAVVLDLWRPETATREALGRVEVAVSLAATLVEELCRRGGSRLLLAVAAEEAGRWSATANPLFARQLLERLALVRGCAENDLAGTLRGVVEQVQPSVQIVVISTRADILNVVSGTEVFVGKMRQRRALGRVTWLDMGAPQLAGLFHLEMRP